MIPNIKQSVRPQVTLDSFVRWAASQIPDRSFVLDCGSGECPYKKYFRHTNYVAVDFAAGDPDWDYSCLDVIADLHELPFSADTFDVIICTEVLEHVKNPLIVLAEINRIGVKGATVYLTIPFLVGCHQEPYDYFRYTPFALRELAEKSGLDLIDIKPGGGFFILLAILLARIPDYFFPPSLTGWSRWLTRFPKAIFRIFFDWMPGLFLPAFDRFDRNKSHTRAYYAILRKSNGIITSNRQNDKE
jgi:SAM-dependent methyltransferase